MQAHEEQESASTEHSVPLITDSESSTDSKSTDSEDNFTEIPQSRKRPAVGKMPSNVKKSKKLLVALHIDLERHGEEAVRGYKQSRLAPDVALKCLFTTIYTRITGILQNELHTLKVYADSQRELDNEPFNSISQKEIRECETVDELFALCKFNRAWLNTDKFKVVMYASSGPVWDSALYCVKFYRHIVKETCCKVLLKNLPKEFHEQLKATRYRQLRSSITITFKKKLKDFNLAELLKNREYLQEMLGAPSDCFDYLEAKSTRSTTVYWEVDATYTARTILDVRQDQIFWSMMEQGIIDFHIEGSTQLSLRGPHIPGLIKNALLKGQNLIKLTQVCMCVFHMRCIIMYLCICLFILI